MSAVQQSDFAAALLDPALPCPAGLRAWNGSDPAARFAVYRNNVVSSLIDALADTFPVVQALVGEEFFRAMAGIFVRSQPPRTRMLAFYGSELPAFVDAFEPGRSVPYLADVARLELARVRAYHALDAAPIAPDQVQAALSQTERLPRLRLTLHPSARIVESSHAVVSIWAAHQSAAEVDLSAVDIGQPEQALVLRQGLDVVVVPLGLGAARFCAALLGGTPLGEVASLALQQQAAFDLSATLAALFNHGAVCAIDLDCET